MALDLLQLFHQDVTKISLPERFTFPFYYEPHELSTIAANALQHHLETQTDFEHDFSVTGKMFGILVVQNKVGQLGYLWAFSGKLAEQNDWPHFVPPVFDMLEENSFFIKGIKELTTINSEVAALENNPDYLRLTEKFQLEKNRASAKLESEKTRIKASKMERNIQRKKAQQEISNPSELAIRLNELIRESQQDQFLIREYEEYLENQLTETLQHLNPFTEKITYLKEKRSAKSAALQNKLFQEYAFLNQNLECKNLNEIFNGNPPAGAGECAAPKLLHHAFQHQLKPIAMAEFWWGQSPKSEVRTHAQFYPACTGKCEPILKHMLKDILIEENPFENNATVEELEFVYEDEYLAVVNKPAGLLSVPGKQRAESVYNRMKDCFPDATGPLIVHRLDMATSGLLLIAKTSEIHKDLQSQFIKRKVRKHYVALLDGLLNESNGLIDLPLRTDFDNRPNQMVCYQYGKTAQTRWEVIERRNGKTLVYFFPITGRTHQLRVHSAHNLGLNTPIVGDALYGNRANRLHLHAESITFLHPITKKELTITVKADFDW